MCNVGMGAAPECGFLSPVSCGNEGHSVTAAVSILYSSCVLNPGTQEQVSLASNSPHHCPEVHSGQ